MKRVQGIYRGLGTAVKIGLGFIPSEVRALAIGNADLDEIYWTRDMARVATGAGGIARASVANAPAFALLANTAGIKPYAGGELVTTASLAHQIAAQSVAAFAGDRRGSIAAWTLDTLANKTGHVDVGLTTATTGVGSPIDILTSAGALVRAHIVALSNDGDAADEVTLDIAVPSGRVVYIGCMWDWVTAPVGTRMPQGIEINDVTYVNVASNNFALIAVE
ncbi:MAG: hypothetical protein PHR35_22095 [Kiritimatiellae bacterium]|nr:hypothetical protein [Kiritimatiellia bacterium]